MKKIILIVILFTFSTISFSNIAFSKDFGCVEGNCKNGTGTFIYKGNRKGAPAEWHLKKDKYIGEWKNGKWNGQGTSYTVHPDHFVHSAPPPGSYGVTTQGEWKDNIYNGKMTITYSWGVKATFVYKNKILIGLVDFTHKDGSKSKLSIMPIAGVIQDKKYTRTYPDGSKYDGKWKNDKKHGLGTYTHFDGKVDFGFFIDDEYIPTICENIGLSKGTESFEQCVTNFINEINEDD
jgi:hypothetical protein